MEDKIQEALNAIKLWRSERYSMNKSLIGVNLHEDKIIDMCEKALEQTKELNNE